MHFPPSPAAWATVGLSAASASASGSPAGSGVRLRWLAPPAHPLGLSLRAPPWVPWLPPFQVFCTVVGVVGSVVRAGEKNEAGVVSFPHVFFVFCFHGYMFFVFFTKLQLVELVRNG